MSDWHHQLLNSAKIATSVAATTVTTGLGTVLEWIPNDIGKLATVIGIILSSVLIYTHWRKGRIEYQKVKLEIKIIRRREAERQIEGGRRLDDP